ncbi:AMIN-like domain-containing (lipo)protein [Labedaea rhizosphaerae]|uniref:AMIN-like domain-containing protein n=1 Tax=Labedaea rhizosphaerae TaxID=598644 RepID=A0A4R6S4F8_LABRH|nr:hypothetical protein [Labedaea rhizosphaerae]TDP93626.1 hypothetical protein EV186_10620 [Labedaea rhizosphaerae]
MNFRRSMRRVAVAAAVVLGLAAPVVLTTTASAAPYCGITWGSLNKAAASTTTNSEMKGVRAGKHTCYDRLVLDFTGHNTGFRVRYVTNVYHDGSGHVVPLRGGAKLEILAFSVGFTPKNQTELANLAGYRTFRQAAWAGYFEGQTTLGLGVRARLPFHAFMLQGPGNTSRLVIDVAHQW